MRFATIIALIAAVTSTPTLAQERTLRLATEGAYPPFNNINAAGQLVGFDVDIGNALCAAMKVKCEWVSQEWDGMIPALQAGKFDAIVASMFITDERKKQIDFTDPYYRTPAAIVAPKDSPLTEITPESLAGKAIGVQISTVYFNWAEKYLTESAIKTYPSALEWQADLMNGRLDAANDDQIVIQQFLDSPEGACCKLVGTVKPILEIHGPGAGIAVRKGDPLAAEFNAAIKAIRADGTYKTINDKYFKVDVYGDAD